MSTLTSCDVPNCPFPPFKDTGKWSRIRAHYFGWYFGKDGSIRCPVHNPEWLIEWRKRRKNK